MIAGVLSWRRVLPRHQTIENIIIGSLWGLILSCFVPFLFSWFVPFKTVVLFSYFISLTAILLFVWVDRVFWFSKVNKLKYFFGGWSNRKKIIVIIFLLLAAFYMFLTSRVLFTDNNGWYTTGFVNAYGDAPFHIMYITSFAFGDNFPPQNPDYAGILSNYPFSPYFLSAAMVSSGADLTVGFLAPIIFLGLITVALLFYVPWKITREAWTAVLTPIIFFLSGGLGFYWFFQTHGLEIFSNSINSFNPAFGVLTHLPDLNINLMNVITSSLMPQRGILFGLPIFLSVILLWYIGDRRSIIASALLTAFLPLLHAQTFIALMIALPFYLLILFIQKLRKKTKFDYSTWIIFFIIVFLAFLPAFFSLNGSADSSYINYIRFTNGWMTGSDNFLWYWFKNLGFFLPVLIGALLYKKIPLNLKLWYLPFLAIFIIPNYIIFSPWEYDNSKFFHLWYLVSAFLVAYFIVILFRNKSLVLKISAGTLFVLIIFSGGVDVLKAVQFSNEGFGLFSPEAQKVAVFIKQNTPPDAVFLSSTSHLSPLILSGRKRLMGYAGWLWAHAINYDQRLNDIKIILNGGNQAKELVEKYNVEYILIGEQEKSEFSVNTRFFEENFQKIYDRNNYQIFITK